MKGHETELIGRVGRMAGANAPVFPLAERGEDGSWQPLEDAKVRFPPSSRVELVSAIAFRIREGDLVVFHTAAANTYRAVNSSRAVGVRKLVRFLGGLPSTNAEDCRRLLVEAGLDDVQAGDWVVKVGPDAVARVTLAQGTDGRWRAASSPRLVLRRFDMAYAVDGSVVSEPGSFYDLDAAERIADVADWSSDADFLTAAANAVPLGEDHSRLLADLVGRYSDALTGRISAAGGHDPQTAAELVRAGVLGARLREEATVLAAFGELVRTDAGLRELVDREAATRVAAEMPALAASARAEIETEMEAARAAAVAQVRAVVEAMEADELAALEERRARHASEIEAKLKDRLEGGMAEVEAAFAARRAELSGEALKLNGLLRTATAEVERLDARKSELEGAIAAMGEREAALIGRVESLARSEEALAARPAAVPRPAQRFTAAGGERRLALSEVGEAAEATRLLSGDGVDAVVRLGVLATAGEVPILVGGGARDFLDVAALVLSGGRLAVLTGDPTTITFEDLWTRPGGNGPTVLGDAAEAAAAGLPILAAITGAEVSGGRFWYPALADARRTGALPAAMMLCVAVDDPSSEEAERLLRGSFKIDAEGLVGDGAALLGPAVFDKFAREPMSLEPPILANDPAAAMAVLSGLSGNLTLNVARRLARLHAAVSSARGEAGAEAAVAAFRDELAPRLPAPAGSTPKLSYLTGRG